MVALKALEPVGIGNSDEVERVLVVLLSGVDRFRPPDREQAEAFLLSHLDRSQVVHHSRGREAHALLVAAHHQGERGIGTARGQQAHLALDHRHIPAEAALDDRTAVPDRCTHSRLTVTTAIPPNPDSSLSGGVVHEKSMVSICPVNDSPVRLSVTRSGLPVSSLSLIHISEPTRRTPISY